MRQVIVVSSAIPQLVKVKIKVTVYIAVCHVMICGPAERLCHASKLRGNYLLVALSHAL